ncbi:ATP-binding protein [[Clostridium] symbiosum]|uniref:AAA family ATPase n=1 Tax=Clostridium symbiosum TaxID=1512 RepID=UPI003312FA28
MFEYIKLKNFKSFGNIEFNLLDKKGNPKQLILLYGENGIGKSNLASAFFMLSETLRTMDVRDIMQTILSEKPDTISDEDFARFFKMRYKDLETLIRENKMVDSNEPMSMEFGFRINGKSGRYLLETNDTQLVHERLEYVLTKNKGTYFDISTKQTTISSKIFLEKSAYQEIKFACSKYWGKHSLLSILMHESDDKADEYIREQLSENFNLIMEFLSRISCKVKFGSRQERGIIGLPHEIFGDFDEGTIAKEDEHLLDKTEKMLNIFFKKMYGDIKKVFYKRTTQENTIHYQLMQTKLIAGKKRNIEFSMESTGTQSLLQLLPFMLVVIKGSTAIIDEFDTGVHDLLVKSIVNSLYNNLSGQLIMTTHNTLLMESGISKECIYVINELENGDKEVQCITYYDNKIHANTNIRDQYMNGKYKGIPKPANIDFNSLLDTLGITTNTMT